MEYRYENIRLKYMKEITRIPSYDDKIVIYVKKCEKFKKTTWK